MKNGPPQSNGLPTSGLWQSGIVFSAISFLTALVHYVFHITLAGSVIAIILVKPLGDFFHIPRPSLTLITLACVLGGLWGFHSKLEPNDKALLANLLPGSWRVSLSHAKINTQTYWFNNHSEDGQGLAFAFVGQLVVGAFPGGKDAARQWHPLSGAKG